MIRVLMANLVLLAPPRLILHAQQADEGLLVARGKKATALVVLPSERGFGTAFCIDDSGFFVTNAHVVDALRAGEKLTLVLNSGEEDEKAIEATVVRTDKLYDLALLKTAALKGVPILDFGDAGELSETKQVTAFGYPFGNLLAVKKKRYPAISVNVGRVTALRKDGKKLESFQLDASLNPGNSGGPILDGRGKVVGVVRAGIRGTGVNSAIPVNTLQEFLTKPEIAFTPPPIPYEKRHEPVSFHFKLVSFAKPVPKMDVEVILQAGAQTTKLKPEPGKDGALQFTAAPVPPSKGALRVPIHLIFPSGRIQCTVEDQAFEIGKKTLRLKDVREINRGNPSKVITRDNTELSGELTGLGKVNAELGGATVPFDLAKTPKIVVEFADEKIDKLEYTIVVKHEGAVLNQLKGEVRFDQAPVSKATPGNPNIEAPRLAGEKTVVNLPAGIEQVGIGGGGRFLILHLKRLNKLAVFDVSQARVAHYLPAPAEDFLFQAGADKLLVIIPGKNQSLIERWSLQTFEKEKSAELPVDYAPARAAMGNNSNGPLLIWGVPNKIDLLDIDTLKKIEVKGLVVGGDIDKHVLQIEAAADGSAFTYWWRYWATEDPSQFRLQRRHGDTFTMQTGVSHLAPCFPSIDGGPVVTWDGNVYTGDMKPIEAKALKNASLQPVGNSYIVVTRWEGEQRKARINVHFMSDLKEAFAIGEVEELNGLPERTHDRTPFTLDRRIHFVPSANVLVTIPSTNDKLVVRKVDVEEALKKTKVDYLFVTSVPVRQADKGKTYTYQLEVKSKEPSYKLALESGPKGMNLSAGRLTWEVPAEFQEAEAPVIVSITSASGQQIFHSFNIKCK